MFLENTTPEAGGILIDDRTGARRTLSLSECWVDTVNIASPFGGPWLMFNCVQNGGALYATLYHLTDRRWHTLPPPPEFCGTDYYPCDQTPVAVGGDWIEWVSQCYHCSDTWFFQNVGTGAVRTLPGWRPGGRTVPDLNSPTPAGKLCAPLRVPASYNGTGIAEPGMVATFGRDAIAYGSNLDGWDAMYLERCGTRLHRFIGGAWPPPQIPDDPFLTHNARALMWAVRGGSIAGAFLRTLNSFKVSVPARLQYPRISLGWRTLYLWDDYRLWTAPAPKPLRASSGRR